MTEIDNARLELLRSCLRICPDFPKKGIPFIDVFGIFSDPKAHRALIDLLLDQLKSTNTRIDAVVGLEARGFIFGPQLALELQVPFVPVRKRGKLPGQVVGVQYELEYGHDTIEMQVSRLAEGAKVVLVDDLLATGGTLNATKDLCVKLGFDVVKILVIIELTNLGGRQRLNLGDRCFSLLKFDEENIKDHGLQ